MLRHSTGFVRTDVSCESKVQGRYRSFDFWISHRDFEAFRRSFQVEIERFNRFVAEQGFVEKELLLGSFYTDESDEGTDLTPA